ncbi:MAG: hypothetical protein QM759_15735 [Terricaulis sp.]
MRWIAVAVALALAACAPAKPAAPALNTLAESYVRLSLEIGTHEDGYIDAYYGPQQWQDEAKAHPRSVDQLKDAADALQAQIVGVETTTHDAAEKRRAHTLAAYVASARFRLDMIGGLRAPFADEALRLFALAPQIKPLTDYDAMLVRINQLVPGRGDLGQRIETFRARYVIPENKLQAVMQAAIDECRRRTLAHIALPQGEHFTLSLVKGQSWGAYNYYRGNNQSEIQVDTDLPIYIDRAVGLGCHEGYPGHHVQGIYAERLYRQSGYVEYAVSPLFSPQGPINEGGGNYGVDLAFPGDQKLVFEQQTLYPLAGLDPATAPAFEALSKAMNDLAGVRVTIAQQYVDGQINHDQAVALLQHYQLQNRDQAEKALRFIDHYRSYVINYVSGEDLVRAFANKAGADDAAHWRAYMSILSQPTLPENLK